MSKHKKPTKQIVPKLHRIMATRFLDYADLDGTIAYGKVKFVLRYIFRVPKEYLTSIINEFTGYNILYRKNQNLMEIGDFISREYEININSLKI